MQRLWAAYLNELRAPVSSSRNGLQLINLLSFPDSLFVELGSALLSQSVLDAGAPLATWL